MKPLMTTSPLARLVEPLQDALVRLGDEMRGLPRLRLGTVTSIDPLRVQLDGDTGPLPASPRTLVQVQPGQRVQVAHQRRVVTVLGQIGGERVSVAGKATRQAGRTVISAEYEQISMNVAGRLDGGVVHSGTGLTVPRDGWYQVSAGLRWSSGSGGTRQLLLRTDEPETLAATQQAEPSSGLLVQNVSTSSWLKAGVTVQLDAYQNSGSSVGISPSVGWGYPYVSLAKVG